MQTTKNIIQEQIYKHLSDNCKNIDDNEAWRCATEISKIYSNHLQNQTKNLNDNIQDILLKLEQQNKIINDIMANLKEYSKGIIDEFITKGLGTYELNKQKTKRVLIPKSTVVGKTCDMLNTLKDLQLEYYSNIFVVQETKNNNLLF